jgi:hypothetical protein
VIPIALCVLAALWSGASAVLLFHGYLQRRMRLLMWSSICLAGLTLTNVALVVNVVMLPDVDLRLARLVPSAIGLACLTYGILWDKGDRNASSSQINHQRRS